MKHVHTLVRRDVPSLGEQRAHARVLTISNQALDHVHENGIGVFVPEHARLA
jgi:hypothetical protein